MTSTGIWTDKDKLVTLEQLGRIQDENYPNELNGGKAFSEGYGKMHGKRKESLVYAKLEDFGRALFDSQVVVVVAATGTGKTLQLPQYCLHQLRALGSKKRIDVVQPSQIATYACGERLSVELDSVNQLTYLWSGAHALPKHDDTASILVTTDKIYSTLYKNEERPLPDTAVIMIDEIHILSLDVEFLLGILHMVLKKRPDLRLILASATCEADRLVKHFSQFSPIKIEVAGTAHHIEHIYLQPDDRRSQETRILQGLRSFFLDPLILTGDCLIFMRNMDDILSVRSECSKRLKREHPAIFDKVNFIVLAEDDPDCDYAYATLSWPAHDGSGTMTRKVILATSVAASSLTLPNVRLVMITGRIEESHFDHRTRSTEMVTRSLALSEIIQMAGRTGRTRSGTVMHLYHCNDSDKLA